MITTHKYISVEKALNKGSPQSGITLNPNTLKILICYVKGLLSGGNFSFYGCSYIMRYIDHTNKDLYF